MFSWVDGLRSAVGVFMGLLLVFIVAKFQGEFTEADEGLMASLGASALIVFALPQCPMAQLWVVIVCNTLSALIGIAVFDFLDKSLLAIPVVAGLFIFRDVYTGAVCIYLKLHGHCLQFSVKLTAPSMHSFR